MASTVGQCSVPRMKKEYLPQACVPVVLTFLLRLHPVYNVCFPWLPTSFIHYHAFSYFQEACFISPVRWQALQGQSSCSNSFLSYIPLGTVIIQLIFDNYIFRVWEIWGFLMCHLSACKYFYFKSCYCNRSSNGTESRNSSWYRSSTVLIMAQMSFITIVSAGSYLAY